MAYGDGTLNLSGNLNVAIGKPLDARFIVENEADLTSASTWTASGANYAYEGITVYCKDTQKTVQLQGSSDYSVAANWHEITEACVHITGDETITGHKQFVREHLAVDVAPEEAAMLRISDDQEDISTQPAIEKLHEIRITDKNLTAFGAFGVELPSSEGLNGNHVSIVRLRAQAYNPNTQETNNNIVNVGMVIFPNGTQYRRMYCQNDNAADLGLSAYRWKQLFAGTATINTSDEREKANIAPYPDEVLDAWGEVQFCHFQFKDAIHEKGEKIARIHSGLIAQRIKSVFEARGLDPSRYALFCHDTWDAMPEQRDGKGNVIQEARQAGDRYALRYEEALCMEAAYQRRRADRLEARLTALEDAFSALKG